MTVAPPPTWPSSRVLAGWWPHLDRLRPRSLWLYHLLLHRVEAPVAVAPPAAQERLTRLLLDLLARGEGRGARGEKEAGSSLAPRSSPLAPRLHIDPQLLGRLLVDLEKLGLVRSGSGTQGWAPTPEGQQVLAGEVPLRPLRERRTFWFAEPPTPGLPARFIPLDRPSTSGWLATGDLRFDVGALRRCTEQSSEWKRRHGFPVEVVGFGHPAAEAWGQVVIDRPEQMLALFVLSGSTTGEEMLLGLAVQPDGWRLQAERPVLALGAGWHEVLPELAEELPADAWRQAWQAWGQAHGLPPTEVEASSLEPKGFHLRVKAPQPLWALGSQLSALSQNGETWVFAGEGRLRSVAILDFSISDFGLRIAD